MRRMRSESWTFIWQPKVRMHAVLAAALPCGLAEGSGFLESFIGTAVCSLRSVSLILFLRLVDAGSHGDLSGTGQELGLPNLKVARPGRPPKYIRDGAPFLLAEREHGSVANRHPRPLLSFLHPRDALLPYSAHGGYLSGPYTPCR